MKKTITVLLIFAILLGCLSACGETAENTDDKLSVVATIFPEYDWVREIIGDKLSEAELTLLLDKGVDLHSYQPSADDMIKIASCDVFIYVGGESDTWVDDALKEATNPDMIVVDLLDVLKANLREEELLPGMQEDEHEHEEGEAEEIEYDEHVWLSLKNAAVCVESISGALSRADAENADIYSRNAAIYIEKLNALDSQYQSTISGAKTQTLLFGDRFPFRYLADDYQLSCYAAFNGCSAETEASFETVVFLAGIVDSEKLSYVVTIEGSNAKIADTIIAATSAKSAQVVSLNSMQNTTLEDIAVGETYLQIMADNLSVLASALN